MQIVNIPPEATSDWIKSQTHPTAHTMDEFFYGVSIENAADVFFTKQTRVPRWVGVNSAFHYLFFDFGQVTAIGVYQSHKGYGHDDHKVGALCNIESCHGGAQTLFLPLTFKVTRESLHRFAKIALLGDIKLGYGEAWWIESQVQELDITPFGKTYLAYAE